MDCELALQDGASVGDALATATARLDVKKPHARFLALHAASATGAVEAAPLGRATALANGGRLVILVRIWTAGLRAAVEEDAALRDLAFRQARCCALADTWPCPVRDGARRRPPSSSTKRPPLSPRRCAPRCRGASAGASSGRGPWTTWAVDVVLELGSAPRPAGRLARLRLSRSPQRGRPLAPWPSARRPGRPRGSPGGASYCGRQCGNQPVPAWRYYLLFWLPRATQRESAWRPRTRRLRLTHPNV